MYPFSLIVLILIYLQCDLDGYLVVFPLFSLLWLGFWYGFFVFTKVSIMSRSCGRSGGDSGGVGVGVGCHGYG